MAASFLMRLFCILIYFCNKWDQCLVSLCGTFIISFGDNLLQFRWGQLSTSILLRDNFGALSLTSGKVPKLSPGYTGSNSLFKHDINGSICFFHLNRFSLEKNGYGYHEGREVPLFSHESLVTRCFPCSCFLGMIPKKWNVHSCYHNMLALIAYKTTIYLLKKGDHFFLWRWPLWRPMGANKMGMIANFPWFSPL